MYASFYFDFLDLDQIIVFPRTCRQLKRQLRRAIVARGESVLRWSASFPLNLLNLLAKLLLHVMLNPKWTRDGCEFLTVFPIVV